MKKILAFVLSMMLLIVAAFPAMAAGYNLETAKESVVRVITYCTVTDDAYPGLKGETFFSVGSGFAIGDINGNSVKHIVTAGHVIMHNVTSENVNVETLLITLDDGTRVHVKVHVDDIRVLLTDVSGFVRANVAGYSPRADVAVLELNEAINVRKPAVLLDKRDFQVGDMMTAMGFPTASESNLASEVNDQFLSTKDAVSTNTGNFTTWSGHSTTRFGDQITTTADMSEGISGGPLVDKDGYVIGVCVAGAYNYNNVNYAVATDEIVALLSSTSGVTYQVGPIQDNNLTTIILIVAGGVLLIGLLIALILSSRNSKKNARTLVMGGVLTGKSIPLKKGVPVVIGRDPKRCQVIYPKDTAGVSGVHCTITFDGKEVSVADNGSSYGTVVGGVKVEPGRPMVMHRGQVISFGSEKNSAELH